MKKNLDAAETTHFLNTCLKIKDIMIDLNGYRHWLILIYFVLALPFIFTSFIQHVVVIMCICAAPTWLIINGNDHYNLELSFSKSIVLFVLVVRTVINVSFCMDVRGGIIKLTDFGMHQKIFTGSSGVCTESNYPIHVILSLLLLILLMVSVIEFIYDALVLLYDIISKENYDSSTDTKINAESDENKEK